MRDDDLLQSVTNFLRTHDQWCDSSTQIIDDNYESAVEEMLRTWEDGDLPGRLRLLADAVENFRREWTGYLNRRTPRNPMAQTDRLWKAVEGLIRERAGFEAGESKALEPVALLLKQNVTPNQIAQHIYGHDGKGPFLKNGRTQADLVQQEADKPGSVIPANFIHPLEQSAAREHQELLKKRIARTRTLAKTHADAPESIEELLRQGVGVSQIAKMKGVSINDVVAAAKAVGVDVGPVSAPIPLPGANFADDVGVDQGDAGYHAAGPLDDDDEDDDEGDFDPEASDDDSDEESDDATHVPAGADDSDLKSKIIELAKEGFSTIDISKDLGVSAQRVAGIIRANKQKQAG